MREAFVRLYDEGLITRGEYIVNWSPVLDTAISDLEVEMKTVAGQALPHRLPGRGERASGIVVATTRPETMLGDTAVAVHPEDERYRHLHRQGGDPAARRAAGSPFVADDRGGPRVRHRPGEGHAVPRSRSTSSSASGTACRGVQVIGRDGRMTASRGRRASPASTASRRARRWSSALREEGYLIKVEDHLHNVGHSQRSGEPIEPLVSTQWFCDVSGMAQQALGARARRPAAARARVAGARPGSTGWRTSSPGASRASSGGATRSRPGTTRTGSCFVARDAARRPRRWPGTERAHAGPRRARHLVLLGPLAVLDPGLAGRHRGPAHLLSRPTCWSPASTSSSSGWRAW